jgi:hypothetical protein
MYQLTSGFPFNVGGRLGAQLYVDLPQGTNRRSQGDQRSIGAHQMIVMLARTEVVKERESADFGPCELVEVVRPVSLCWKSEARESDVRAAERYVETEAPEYTVIRLPDSEEDPIAKAKEIIMRSHG